jgi:hypothetical protein
MDMASAGAGFGGNFLAKPKSIRFQAGCAIAC